MLNLVDPMSQSGLHQYFLSVYGSCTFYWVFFNLMMSLKVQFKEASQIISILIQKLRFNTFQHFNRYITSKFPKKKWWTRKECNFEYKSFQFIMLYSWNYTSPCKSLFDHVDSGIILLQKKTTKENYHTSTTSFKLYN